MRDLTGQQFGRLTVLRELGPSKSRGILYLCQCLCGKVCEKDSKNLLYAGTQSCGCLQRDVALVRHLQHGATIGKGMTPEYRSFAAAKMRCRNPNNPRYHRYGGRGIKFLFTSFNQWFAELGPKPSLDHSVDRIDNDGHYEPGNVRWATRSQQRRNQCQQVLESEAQAVRA